MQGVCSFQEDEIDPEEEYTKKQEDLRGLEEDCKGGIEEDGKGRKEEDEGVHTFECKGVEGDTITFGHYDYPVMVLSEVVILRKLGWYLSFFVRKKMLSDEYILFY